MRRGIDNGHFESGEVAYSRPTPVKLKCPPELAFLPRDLVDDAVLSATARVARVQNVCAVRVLIAAEHLESAKYYKALAEHLNVDFVDGWPQLAFVSDVAAAHRAGFVELDGTTSVRWLAAPQDDVLRALIFEHRSGRRWSDLAITTPAHLASILHFRAQRNVEWMASDALPAAKPKFSVKEVFGNQTATVSIAVVAVLALLSPLFIRPICDLLGLLFLIGIGFRLALCLYGLEPLQEPTRQLTDAELPPYTVLVPLHAEANIVPDLLAALEAIDYPRAKLETLILIEPEDFPTRAALANARLPPWVHVVFGPLGGQLRTKPRALNIGLLMAQGTLLTVFDAEDRPCPNQLRHAAALFAASPPSLACLQARLSIDNGSRSLLARMFALEYATLFDVLNIGISHLRLPMALGGTSCHFRAEILREAGGWDAWNVTEDADLGLRLARLGFDVAAIPSTTLEAAPEEIGAWMKQRRRWTKGWMQTFVVLVRDFSRVSAELGTTKTVALALLLTNLVVGPLLFPIFSAYVLFRFARNGLASPTNIVELGEATLEAVVVLFGIGSTLWCGYVGLRARGLVAFVASLPLLLPYQLMVSLAAWMGLWDLVRRPYHWHKTVHAARARNLEQSKE